MSSVSLKGHHKFRAQEVITKGRLKWALTGKEPENWGKNKGITNLRTPGKA